ERSHGQHTNTDEITQLNTTNQPKIHLIKSKSRVASYLARKTSDPGKSEKNLPLAPNVDNKNISVSVTNKSLTPHKEFVATHKFVAPNVDSKNLSPKIKTSRTSNNQLHVNNNTILEKNNTSKKKKAKPPLEKKPKQEFSKENIKQNESTEKWVNKQYNPKKCKRFVTHLLPESFPRQVKKLRELVKENENRVKLIGVTTDARWDGIVKTTIITQSNIVQIFLKYLDS
ncbi:3910_t:CDS:1, partial [Dentiscutata erythropus]